MDYTNLIHNVNEMTAISFDFDTIYSYGKVSIIRYKVYIEDYTIGDTIQVLDTTIASILLKNVGVDVLENHLMELNGEYIEVNR